MTGKLVFQSDFGLKDGAVSAMKGIAYGIDANLLISDITHDITPFNIREASYRLFQVVQFWPEGTVFVSVVDPGVGSRRRSVVAELSGNRYIVTPDNGTLTQLFLSGKILALREIDESAHRRHGSSGSHTFHGRDVYACTGARLACGQVSFKEIGKKLSVNNLFYFEKKEIEVYENSINGHVEILDVRFGHVWSDIPESCLESLDFSCGDMLKVEMKFCYRILYSGHIPFCKTFSDVSPGDGLVYINSLMNVAVGIHQGNFAALYKIKPEPDYEITISRV